MKPWLALALTCVVGACGNVADNKTDGGGGGDGGGSGSGTFTLSVDPASLTLPIASSMTVAVSVARTGTVGDIALTSPNLPANLTASFSPASLPEGTDTAELTITAVGGMGPGTGTVTVRASGGGADHDASVSVTTTTITVSGKLRGNTQNVTVGIIGKPVVQSGAGGVFTFTDVTPPYDLYTLGDSGPIGTPIPTVYYYDDLTVADPIVDVASQSFIIGTFCTIGQICSSNVSGSRLGAGNNTDSMLVAWSKGGTQLSTTGTWTNLTARGFTASASTGTLHALQMTRTAGQPTGYFYGTTNTTLNAATATVNVSLAALGTTAAVTGTLTQPAGFPAPTVTMTQQFQGASIDYPSFTSATINSIVPALGAEFSTGFFATTTAGGATSSRSQAINGAAADVTYTMLVPPQQTAPVVGATGVTTTTPLTWTSTADTVHEVVIGNANVSFHVFTSKLTTTVPAVPERPLPGGQNLTWTVTDYAGATDVNAFVRMTRPLPATTGIFEGTRAHAVSTSRTFTSAN